MWTTSAALRAQVRTYGRAGVVQPLGAPQASEYGAGAGGAFAAEIPFHAIAGVQLSLGAFAVTKGDRPADPSLADHGSGAALTATLGVRVHPLGASRAAGPWFDVGGGGARTGSLGRGVVEAHVGYDFRISKESRWDVGPFVGFTQVLQPDHELRPEDARIGWLGVSFGLGAAPNPQAPSPPRDETVVSVTREPDPEPEVIVEVEVHDRDGDGVPDAVDACPDLPGIGTDDPKTTGCPPAVDGVRFEGDRIVLGDVIHFDNDSPRVRHVSWPIVKKVADAINANPDVLEIDIEGHADYVGSEEHNARLSLDRAESVRRLLVQYGVDPKRITTRGFGKTRPRVQGYGEQERRQNRRVEFVITKARSARVASP